MPAKDAIYRGFSSPYEFLDDMFLETVAVEYARGFAERFVCRCRRNWDSQSRELLHFLQQCLEERWSFDTVWDDSFGLVRRAVRDLPTFGLMRTAATLGMRMLECGQQGEWEIELETPVRLRWDNVLLPRASWIRVTGARAGATILYRNRACKQRIKIRRSKGGWQSDGLDALSTIDKDGHRYILAFGEAVDALTLHSVPKLKSTSMDLAQHKLLRALDLLTQFAPIYSPWVGRVLRMIIPVKSRRNTIVSGSDQDHPGTVYLSIHCSPVAIAEMLIHEATHQYFYLLSRCGALDDGSSKLFYSPIKRTKRPIRMILLAHHAFGNVLLFYRLCRQKGLSDAGYCERHEAQLAPQVQRLQDTLASANRLTPLGDALWQPLASRLD
ncbi:MAG: HEXXH motif-containing putative peptide modification protein [Candidatus Acidiferrales bacterium]